MTVLLQNWSLWLTFENASFVSRFQDWERRPFRFQVLFFSVFSFCPHLWPHPKWEDLKMKSSPPQASNLLTVTSQREKYHYIPNTILHGTIWKVENSCPNLYFPIRPLVLWLGIFFDLVKHSGGAGIRLSQPNPTIFRALESDFSRSNT